MPRHPRQNHHHHKPIFSPVNCQELGMWQWWTNLENMEKKIWKRRRVHSFFSPWRLNVLKRVFNWGLLWIIRRDFNTYKAPKSEPEPPPVVTRSLHILTWFDPKRTQMITSSDNWSSLHRMAMKQAFFKVSKSPQFQNFLSDGERHLRRKCWALLSQVA